MAATPTRAVKAPLMTPSPNLLENLAKTDPPATEPMRSSPMATAPVAITWAKTRRVKRQLPKNPERPPYISAILRIMRRLVTRVATTSTKASGIKAVRVVTCRAAASIVCSAKRSKGNRSARSAASIIPSASNMSGFCSEKRAICQRSSSRPR